ncbi:hypothetical protein OC835_000281 [Tilletia horrida]|uniref:MADS-box domain-containing protein n=1 Tax=Tilletia horrida TaxID=155126 RepID=A0AAN6JN52_9BASI|nr:hypothetical protein OC842_000403 [Tilletia horrida]KAK0541189.1 hypothetical protein OC835_000281 [Tilletia horrida]
MGRKKIKIARIEDERSRQVTFLKRRNGVMKKAHELAVLTGSDVGLIIFNGQGKLSEFCSGDMRALLQRYSQYNGPADSRGPQFYENLSREKEEDDDDEQDTSAVAAGPSSSLDASMSSRPSTSSPLPTNSLSSAAAPAMGTDSRLLQPMDPPSGAFAGASSMSRLGESSRPTRLGVHTSFTPADPTAAAAELSPVSFNSSRASSIAGHMSGVQIGPPLHQRMSMDEGNVFNFEQSTAVPTPSPFGMGAHAHQMLSNGSLAARRSSFPTQHVDHTFLAGTQILRPQTSAGGVQPAMHAMAPSGPSFTPFSFQAFQPSPMTTTAPTMQSQQAPPSAWNSSNFSSHFGGNVLPHRPQLFSASSDSRMTSSTSSFLMEHESPFGADNDGSQADLVEGINQALQKKRKAGTGREWNPATYTTSTATPLRFSATIPMPPHPNSMQQAQAHAAHASVHSLAPPTNDLGRLKDQSERSQSFSGISALTALRPGSGSGSMLGLGTTDNGSATSLPLSDSHLHLGGAAGSVDGGSGVSGIGLLVSNFNQHTASSSSAGASLSPVSTGTSAPGASASVPSAPSSIFESPSLANSGKAGDATSSVSSHGGGAAGSTTSLPEMAKAAAATQQFVPSSATGSLGSSLGGMAIPSAFGDDVVTGDGGALEAATTGNSGGFPSADSAVSRLDLDRLMGNMISHESFAPLASAPAHGQIQTNAIDAQHPQAQLQHPSLLPEIGELGRTSSGMSTGADLGTVQQQQQQQQQSQPNAIDTHMNFLAASGDAGAQMAAFGVGALSGVGQPMFSSQMTQGLAPSHEAARHLGMTSDGQDGLGSADSLSMASHPSAGPAA